jgi:hypothetical protein
MEFGDPYFAEHPAEWFCSQLGTSSGTGTQGCSPIPDAEGRFDGKLLTPSYSLLGTDRFFSVIAPKGVTAMAVTIRGETKPALSRSIDAGSAGRLLVVTVGGPTVTSRDRSSSRDYDVELLGPNGEALRELTMSDPPVD